MSYFPKPHINQHKTEVELNLSNYTTKYVLKNTTGVDIS